VSWHGEPSWPAPAKINLFLHVLGRRADGYHDLQTVFQFIDLCDELSIVPRDDGLITRQGDLPGIAVEADLAVRAARALQSAAGSRRGADIRLTKRIPVGGGLGGGSSDAATVLIALNHLWGLGWPKDRLAALGADLGADVPVFTGGLAAWAEGKGEKLTPLVGREAPAAPHYVIVNPGIPISTAEVFQAAELTRNSSPLTIRGFLAEGGRNDCEPTVRQRFPAVAVALDWLSQWGRARLTGTGSCVYLACESADEARRIAEQMPAEFTGFVARGLNRSPLLDRLEQMQRQR
jgi:4-diphosphocytidyl-2-C-methyl-D-erythritol kinase